MWHWHKMPHNKPGADQGAAAEVSADAMEEIVVTGIRMSLQRSLDSKRDSGLARGSHLLGRHRQDA
jgi:hypothetical protein